MVLPLYKRTSSHWPFGSLRASGYLSPKLPERLQGRDVCQFVATKDRPFDESQKKKALRLVAPINTTIIRKSFIDFDILFDTTS
jgi:hypothetical protein